MGTTKPSPPVFALVLLLAAAVVSTAAEGSTGNSPQGGGGGGGVHTLEELMQAITDGGDTMTHVNSLVPSQMISQSCFKRTAWPEWPPRSGSRPSSRHACCRRMCAEGARCFCVAFGPGGRHGRASRQHRPRGRLLAGGDGVLGVFCSAVLPAVGVALTASVCAGGGGWWSR